VTAERSAISTGRFCHSDEAIAFSGGPRVFFLDSYQLQTTPARLDSPNANLRVSADSGGRGCGLGRRADEPLFPVPRSQTMSTVTPRDDDLDEPIPAMQQLLDNPFLLLFLGIAMPTVLYVIWGVMEIVGIPIAK
jgi:hypothetical protein